jgi:hypothetical protein
MFTAMHAVAFQGALCEARGTGECDGKSFKNDSSAVSASDRGAADPADAAAGVSGAADSVEAAAAIRGAPSDSSGILLLRPAILFGPTTTLRYSVRQQKNTMLLYRYEVYHASPYECALRGAGAGATLGMAAGAFGMMAGAWDEENAWYIAGAMAAVGAIFGTAKSDDPSWNLQIRLHENQR